MLREIGQTGAREGHPMGWRLDLTSNLAEKAHSADTATLERLRERDTRVEAIMNKKDGA